MNFLTNESIKQLCPLNYRCKDKLCEMRHPRIFRPVCINNIQGKCNQQPCEMDHIQLSQLRILMQVPPINGIYQHNLCRKKKCIDFQCQYLHPPWLHLVCWQCLNFDQCNDGIFHEWLWLKEQVYEKYDKQGINPENICLCKQQQTCRKESHKLLLDGFCIQYFKGTCPNIVCLKPHVEWEDFKQDIIPYNLVDLVLKPCIRIDGPQVNPQSQTYTHNIYQNQHQLDYLNLAIKEQPIIDIIFILDCTCSMADWIFVAQHNICGIIQEFKSKIPYFTVRIAAVCYRDFSDEQHIFYHNFTTKGEKIDKFISKFEAKGGDDLPEDLVGALEKAYTLNISAHINSMLNIFIITDAPCHGRCYHHLVQDNYGNNQDGKLEQILSKFQNLKPRLFLYFFQISKNTKKMEEIMKKIVRSFFILKGDTTEFNDWVRFSLERSYLQGSQMRSIQTSCLIYKVQFVKQKSIKLNYDQSKKQYNYLNYFNQQFKTESKILAGSLSIEKQEFPIKDFEKGSEQTIFQAFDISNNRYVALKIPQEVVRNFSQGKLTNEQINKAHLGAKVLYKQAVMASQLAQIFNQRVRERKLQQYMPPLYYAAPLLYTFDQPFQGLTIIYGETFLDCEEIEWIKYTNNHNYKQKETLMTAFSHFTYEFTNHEVMITDIQGKANLLSDPAIHTNNINEFICSSNLHEEGINLFFNNQHPKCNIVCEKMDLPSHIIISESQITQESSPYHSQVYENIDQNLYQICQNCGRQDDYHNDRPDFCQKCEYENKKESKIVECTCCKQNYQQNYDFEQLQNSVVQICIECQNRKCRELQKKCYYCEQNICLQFKHSFIIENQQVILCQDAFRFLQSIKCQNCNVDYKFQKFLNKQSYSLGQFICC